MKSLKVLLAVISLMMTAAIHAQIPQGDARYGEALKMGLYPPDMIMHHQGRLGITKDQRKTMAASVKQFQSDVAELQWNLQSEQQALKQLLEQYSIDSDAALQQVDTVLALENDFKRAHFQLLIAIKNALSKEQIDMINQHLKQRRNERQGR